MDGWMKYRLNHCSDPDGLTQVPEFSFHTAHFSPRSSFPFFIVVVCVVLFI